MPPASVLRVEDATIMTSIVADELRLVMPITNASPSSLLPYQYTALFTDSASPVLHLLLSVVSPTLLAYADGVAALPPWLQRPCVLVTGRFASGDVLTIELSVSAVSDTTSVVVGDEALSRLRASLAPWKEPLLKSRQGQATSAQSTPSLPAAATPQVSFGVPAAFASRGASGAPTVTASSSAYGASDLAPAGGDQGYARQGGIPVGAAGSSLHHGGGMMFGPQNPMFGAGPTPFGSSGSGAFGSDPAAGFARYDPIHPSGGGIGGGIPQRPGGFGVGPGGFGQQVFPGEPDADHLRPWNNSGPQDAFMRGRGGFGQRGRGRGFGGPPSGYC